MRCGTKSGANTMLDFIAEIALRAAVAVAILFAIGFVISLFSGF
jgi:hypothetical protein